MKKPITLSQTQELLWGVFTGEDQDDQFRLIRTSNAEFEFEVPEKWTLDGEYGGTFRTAKMEVLHKAISFIL